MRFSHLMAMVVVGAVLVRGVFGQTVGTTAPATRVAVLHVGPNDEEGAKGSGGETLGIDVPIAPYLKAAEELKKAGTEVVVFRINCSGGQIEPFVDAIERVFRPQFRTVGWVRRAVNGAGVAALALPEACMTADGYWGAASHGDSSGDLLAWLAMGERAAKIGGRDPLLARAMQIVQPVSVSLRDGRQVFLPDLSGELVLNKEGGRLGLNATTAVACGVSAGKADTRKELVRALGLERVEWVGAEVDVRVRAVCDDAAADLKKAFELHSAALLAHRASSASKEEAVRTRERGKRDAAWAEMAKLRAKWPELVEAWPQLLVTSTWNVHQTAAWSDVAHELGIEELPAVAK